MTKEKPVSEKTVAAVQEELPKLEFVEKDLAYKTVEKKDSTLFLSETRVEQEGKLGKERIFTSINPDGSKEEKLHEVVEAPTDRIVLVGTKLGTFLPEDEIKNLVLNRPELVVEEETIDFKVQEQKNDKLPAGQTRVHLIEVENGKRTEKDSYDKVLVQNRIVEVGTAGETTIPVAQEATKPQVLEKADTKQIALSEASQANKVQLPNTGSAVS